jgi:hypothetical protein
MINNKPGPAPGHGRGCVTCHKSACSLVGKSKKPNTNKKTIKPQKTIKAVAQQSAQ